MPPWIASPTWLCRSLKQHVECLSSTTGAVSEHGGWLALMLYMDSALCQIRNEIAGHIHLLSFVLADTIRRIAMQLTIMVRTKYNGCILRSMTQLSRAVYHFQRLQYCRTVQHVRATT